MSSKVVELVLNQLDRAEFEATGDRFKAFEQVTDSRLPPESIVIIRLDGRAFSKFTKRFEKPYDLAMSQAMQETTVRLAKEFHATIGYTQSDEITLVFRQTVDQIFGGRVQKLVSLTAAFASVVFNEEIRKGYPQAKIAMFDSRVFTVPTIDAAIKALKWREADAIRNSISMAAQAFYSHKELNRKNNIAKLGMLQDKVEGGWESYPGFFKHGSYILPISEQIVLSEETLAKIPEQHRPTEPVTRTKYQVVEGSSLYFDESLLQDLAFRCN